MLAAVATRQMYTGWWDCCCSNSHYCNISVNNDAILFWHMAAPSQVVVGRSLSGCGMMKHLHSQFCNEIAHKSEMWAMNAVTATVQTPLPFHGFTVQYLPRVLWLLALWLYGKRSLYYLFFIKAQISASVNYWHSRSAYLACTSRSYRTVLCQFH